MPINAMVCKAALCYTILMLTHPITRRTLKWSTLSLGALSLFVVGYAAIINSGYVTPESLEGRLLPAQTQGQMKWITISAEQVASGTTIPANSNVVINIPDEVKTIARRTLFGRSGDTIRYWGYCFPANYAEAKTNTRYGFPGEVFLSESERKARASKLEAEQRRTFSVFKNLTSEDLNQTTRKPASYIRHELEIFEGGTSCYVMTEKPIPVGIDRDEDGLNSALERAHGASDLNPDTDGDGVTDALEVFRLSTFPTKRDSDGDGIIDGIEDSNRNGRYDPGETNPMEWDTDRDGLCDGLCKVNKGQDLRGEDKNLNGTYEPDLNEYDPRTMDSDNDGIRDDHEVYLCITGGGDDC